MEVYMAKKAFINGYVFNTNSESFVRCNVICEDGLICDITSNFVPHGCEVIDISGKYLIPGMVDVHTHGIGGYDFCGATEENVKEMCKAYAKNGTTSVMATLASDRMSRLIDSVFSINPNRLNEGYRGANILGVHMEGRYLNPEKRGAHATEYLALPNLKELESLTSAMLPAPMHFSVAPELEGSEAFIKRIVEIGGTVGIAHTNATYEQAYTAIKEWGATSFTHTFNAMTSVHHRNPGATVCAMTCDDAYAEVICDGHHLAPAIVNLIYKSKPKDKMVLITDSLAAAGSPEGEYEISGAKYIVKNGHCVNEFGTIAGSILTLFEGMKNFMKFCNIPLIHALKYATINPAKMVNADFIGKIEKGYQADFIVINNPDAPKILDVYVGANKIQRD